MMTTRKYAGFPDGRLAGEARFGGTVAKASTGDVAEPCCQIQGRRALMEVLAANAALPCRKTDAGVGAGRVRTSRKPMQR